MLRRSRLINTVIALAGILSVVVALLINVVSGTLSFLPAWVSWPSLILAVGLAIFLSIRLYHLQNSPSAREQERQQFRKLVLAKAPLWINDRLEPHLRGATFITPSLSELSDPFAFSDEQDLLSLPPITNIIQTFEKASDELLILGKPGCGKTVYLLKLAQELFQWTSGDDARPVPVVFNLSSWSPKHQLLTDWLVEALHASYKVEPAIGQFLVDSYIIFPLLDGLDEVDPDHRAACADAINAYRRGHSLLPTVVCSRSAEYEILGKSHRMDLRQAVAIQPFSPKQIDEYLAGLKEEAVQMAPLRTALRYDQELQELASNPLVLSLLVKAYRGKALESLPKGSLDARRRHVFETYVNRMLEEQSEENISYASEQVKWWLSWLAEQMKQHDQATEFYIERLQPDWLPNARSRQLYRGMTTMILVEFFCTTTGLLVGQLPGICFGFLVGILIGILNILLSYVLRPLHPWLRYLIKSPYFGFFGGLNFANLTMLFIGLSFHGQNTGLTNGLLFGIIVGAFGLYIDKLAGEPGMKIEPAEVVVWSWSRMGSILIAFLLLGLAGGILARFFGTADTWLAKLIIGLFFGLIIGLFFGLIGGWVPGVVNEKKRVTPNQGIWRSFRNGGRSGLLAGLIIGSLVGLLIGIPIILVLKANPEVFFGIALQSDIPGIPVWLEFGLGVGLVLGLGSGVFTGLVTAFFRGWSAWIKHFILRFLLWMTNYAPWRYSRFLDYAAHRFLLFKVGGGYQFIHRLLGDHFAPPRPASQPCTISPQPHNRASVLLRILALVLVLVSLGLSLGVFQIFKHL